MNNIEHFKFEKKGDEHEYSIITEFEKELNNDLSTSSYVSTREKICEVDLENLKTAIHQNNTQLISQYVKKMKDVSLCLYWAIESDLELLVQFLVENFPKKLLQILPDLECLKDSSKFHEIVLTVFFHAILFCRTISLDSSLFLISKSNLPIKANLLKDLGKKKVELAILLSLCKKRKIYVEHNTSVFQNVSSVVLDNKNQEVGLKLILKILCDNDYSNDEIMEAVENLKQKGYLLDITPLISTNKNDLTLSLHSKYYFPFPMEYFITAIENNNFDFILLYRNKLEELKLEKSLESLVKSLISSMKTNTFFEIKIFLLKNLLDQIDYFGAINFVKFILKNFHDEEEGNNSFSCFLYFVANPAKISVLIIEILKKLKHSYYSLSFRCKRAIKYLEYFVTKIQSAVFDINEMHELFTDKDLENRTVLEIMTSLKLLKLFENELIHNIVLNHWETNYASTDNIFIASSGHKELFQNNLKMKVKTGQIFEIKRSPKIIHSNIFEIWKRGAKTKFYSILFVNFVQTLCFQILFQLCFAALGKYYAANYSIACLNPRNEWETSIIEECENISDLTSEVIFLMKLSLYLNWIYIFLIVKVMIVSVYWKVKKINFRFFYIQIILDLLTAYISYNRLNLNWQCAKKQDEGVTNFAKNTDQIRCFDERLFPFFSGLFMGIMYLQIVFSLKITKLFGPIITIFQKMITNIIKFLMVYFLNLCFFSGIFSFIFVDIPDYSNFLICCLTLFRGSLGDFDYKLFSIENLENLQYLAPVAYHNIGMWSLTLFLIINAIILLNLIIAILSDTYSKNISKSNSLYNYEVSRHLILYKYDREHGSIISSYFPLIILLSPIFFLILISRNKYLRIKLNSFAFHIEYFWIMLVLLMIFILYSTVLIPFYYMKILILKLMVIFKSPEIVLINSSFRITSPRIQKIKYILEFLGFLLFGLILIILQTIIDWFWFFIGCYIPKNQLRSKIQKEKIEHSFHEKHFSMLLRFLKNPQNHNLDNQAEALRMYHRYTATPRTSGTNIPTKLIEMPLIQKLFEAITIKDSVYDSKVLTYHLWLIMQCEFSKRFIYKKNVKIDLSKSSPFSPLQITTKQSSFFVLIRLATVRSIIFKIKKDEFFKQILQKHEQEVQKMLENKFQPLEQKIDELLRLTQEKENTFN